MPHISLSSPYTNETIRVLFTDELQADLKKIDNSFQCNHENTKIVNVKYKDGTIHTKQYCMNCGVSRGQSPKRDENLEVVDVTRIRDDFEDRREQARFDCGKRHDDNNRKFSAEFRKKYAIYLTTEEWKEKRQKVFERDNYLCQGCLTEKATQVHHTTYNNIFHELLFELVSICRNCHQSAHPEKNLDYYIRFDDLPCYGCRYNLEPDCGNFDCSLSLALVDDEKCGPNLNGFEGLK